MTVGAALGDLAPQRRAILDEMFDHVRAYLLVQARRADGE